MMQSEENEGGASVWRQHGRSGGCCHSISCSWREAPAASSEAGLLDYFPCHNPHESCPISRDAPGMAFKGVSKMQNL